MQYINDILTILKNILTIFSIKDFILGILCGFLSSYGMYRYLKVKQPEIVISEKLVKRKHPVSGLWEYKYRIINASKRPVINIKAHAEIVVSKWTGITLRGLELPLTHNEWPILQPIPIKNVKKLAEKVRNDEKFRIKHRRKLLDCKHTFTIDVYKIDPNKLQGLGFTKDQINEIKRKIENKDEEYGIEFLIRIIEQIYDRQEHEILIRVWLVATDAESNFTKIFYKTYTLKDIAICQDFYCLDLEPKDLIDCKYKIHKYECW